MGVELHLIDVASSVTPISCLPSSANHSKSAMGAIPQIALGSARGRLALPVISTWRT